MSQVDLFLLAGEPSGDLHGAKLIGELLALNPTLKIAAVAGPEMRKFPIECIEPMESLQVMGFTDIVLALPKLMGHFFHLRNQILTLNPKALVTIDYPGLNLRLQKAVRKRAFKGKQIHYICPTVWAWGKKRIPQMAKNLDLLLTILPFEPACFAHTNLAAEYVGHPLVSAIEPGNFANSKLISLFPGSRPHEIERNLPLQLAAAAALQAQDRDLTVAISAASPARAAQIRTFAPSATLVPFEERYSLMRASHLALAKSGTVTLELALHNVPTVITYPIKRTDLFLATKIFRIHLPFYGLPNLILQKELFPELFGPNLTSERLLREAQNLCFDDAARQRCFALCAALRAHLGPTNASKTAAQKILESL